MIFAKIPATYPVIINKMNLKLIFFADFALTFFTKLIGHDKPKQINIIASKASFIDVGERGVVVAVDEVFDGVVDKVVEAFGLDKVRQQGFDGVTNAMPYLNKGSRRGKHARTTVWGKLLICECGHTFNTRRWDRPDRQPGNAYQCYSSVHTGSYESRKKKGLPLEGICQSPMIPEWRLQMMANLIFRKYLSQKDKVLALANSILENYNGNTDEDRRNEAALEMKQRELGRLQKRMDNLIEMRADGDLSKDMFRMKSEELEPKMQKLQKEIEELSQKREPKVIEHYKEKLTILQYALSQYSCPKEGEDVPESVIEAYFSKIVVKKDGFDWYIRINGDPDKPLHCKLEGKRRSTTKVVVTQDFSPALDSSTTGCVHGIGGAVSVVSSDDEYRHGVAKGFRTKILFHKIAPFG